MGDIYHLEGLRNCALSGDSIDDSYCSDVDDCTCRSDATTVRASNVHDVVSGMVNEFGKFVY
jgi:hypothetical protein